MIAQHVICTWFRDAILEAPEARELRTELVDGAIRKACAICGKDFIPTGKRSKYCSSCAEKARLKRQRNYMREKRGEC